MEAGDDLTPLVLANTGLTIEALKKYRIEPNRGKVSTWLLTGPAIADFAKDHSHIRAFALLNWLVNEGGRDHDDADDVWREISLYQLLPGFKSGEAHRKHAISNALTQKKATDEKAIEHRKAVAELMKQAPALTSGQASDKVAERSGLGKSTGRRYLKRNLLNRAD